MNIEDSYRGLSTANRHSAHYLNKNGAGKYFAAYKYRSILDEMDFNGYDFDTKIIKSNLQSSFWKNEELFPEIRTQILKIAKEFYEFLNISPVKLSDIVLTGSIANYNWTENSDVDIHLILDFKKLDIDEDFLMDYFATKKALWQLKHDIKIKGFETELYVQNIDIKHTSTGVFSVVKNKWLIKPEKSRSIEINLDVLKTKVAAYMNYIDEIESIGSQEKKYKLIDTLKDKIARMRQDGLDRAGEFSIENITFKILRNSGYLEKMSKMKTDAFDHSLSLNESTEVKKNYNTLFVEKGIKGMSEDKIEIIKDFISFVRDKIKIQDPVTVSLRNTRDRYISTTASYLPSENINFVRCGGRALVDILRSIAHELVHNRQRELNLFQVGEDVPNIGYKIEDQANSIAGILIKDFTHNHGYDRVYDYF